MNSTRIPAVPCRLFAGVAGFFLASCATPFRAPPDVSNIELRRVDSSVVIVNKIWLERKSGPLVVRGSVLKRLEATDTSRTHLDVTLYAADGRVLRSTVEHFEPRQIERQYRHPSEAGYEVVLDPLPLGTARVEVCAHEGEHATG